MKIIEILLTNINIIGLGLNFIASLGWAIQTFIESYKDLKGRVLSLYTEQQNDYRKKRNRNLIWLILLCLGFLLQFIDSY
jgi:hypothetical protein